MLKSLLAKTPPRVRSWVHSSARLHGLASKASAAIWRDDSWQWCRIGGGAAEGLWIQAQPRTQKYQVAGTYEPAVHQALALHGSGGVVWDVGAHVGYFVLVALRLGNEVVAIEPNPENAERLRAALARNRLDATVVEAAVGALEGTAHLEVDNKSSTGQVSTEGTPVVMTTLDALYEKHRTAPPSLVKIDVEGFEGNVLLGATRLLSEVRPTLLIELHPWADGQHVFDCLVDYDRRELGDDHILASPR